MRCGNCGNQRVGGKNPVWSFMYNPSPEWPDMQSFFDQYERPVEMSGGNKYDCDQCGKVPRAVRSTQIASLPENLVAQASIVDSATGRKAGQRVEVPEELRVSGNRYGLFGVLRRSGVTFASGHYVAVVKVGGPTGSWERLDDQKCDESDAAEAKQCLAAAGGVVDAPHMVFYRKTTTQQPFDNADAADGGEEVKHTRSGAEGDKGGLGKGGEEAKDAHRSAQGGDGGGGEEGGEAAERTHQSAQGSGKEDEAGRRGRGGGEKTTGGKRQVPPSHGTPPNSANARPLPGEFKCNGNCGCYLSKDSFSARQLQRGADVRLCNACVARRATTFTCLGPCGLRLPKASFSQDQFQRGGAARRCNECTSKRPSAFRCNGQCGRHLPKASFSRSQFSRGAESRRCLECANPQAEAPHRHDATAPRSPEALSPPCFPGFEDKTSAQRGGAASGPRGNGAPAEGDTHSELRAAKRVMANSQNLPSEDVEVLGATKRLMGKEPTRGGRAIDYAAIVRDLGGVGAACRLTRQGQVYTLDSTGRLNVFRKAEWFAVVPDAGRKFDLLNSAHFSAMHGSWRAMNKELLVRKVFWQYMHYDCAFIAKKCEDCQLRKGKSLEDEVPPLTTGPRALECNDLVSIDLKRMPGAEQMCLVADYCSHHIEGAALRNKTALAVAQFLYKLFLRNDPPVCILSDDGGEFKNEMAATCKSEWQVGRRSTSVGHPCANGPVERMNGVVADFLSKLG